MIELTTAAPDDWARYRRLRLAALADTPDAFWSTTADEADQPESWWRGRLAAPDRLTAIATAAGVDVGTMGAGPHHDDPADALLYAVWVAPSARGSGAAAALLAHVTSWARERGHARLRLDVGDHNGRAIAFYRRAGFTPTGVTSAFPAPRDHVTEHELSLDLRRV